MKTVSSVMVLEISDRYMQNDETRSPTYTRINLKWIKDLNVSHETIQILEENIGSKVSDIFCSNIISYISPQIRETKEKINKSDYTKLKSASTAKETINKMKRQPTEWKNIFTNDTSDKGIKSKIYKELIQLNTKKNKHSN